MCRYCDWPARRMQVKGGGRYGRARVVGGTLRVCAGDREVEIRIRRCPMCGRRLEVRGE